MVGVRLEPPGPPAEAGLRPGRAPAKRSWPSGCSRSPAPAAAGHADTCAGVLGGGADEAIAPGTVSPVAQNGSLPRQHGLDKVEEAAALVVQNGALPQLVITPVAVVPVVQNGATPLQEENKVDESVALAAALDATHNGALPRSGPERAGENGEAQNGEVGRKEVAIDGDAMEMRNKTGGAELEKKENGVAGSKAKRWLGSVLNPPPKKRAVSAVRKFPPGCGRTAVVTTGSGVSEVSPIRSFPPGCGRTAVTTTNSGVLEVSPVCPLPPGCGADNGDVLGRSLEAAPVNNGDSLGEVIGLGGVASPTLALEASNEKLEGHSKAHNGVQVLDDFVGTKQDRGQPDVVAKATLMDVSHEKNEWKLSPHEGKQVARAVVDEKMKNKPDGSLQRSDAIDAKTKGKRLESDKRNTSLLGNINASVEGKMQGKILSAKKEVCSNENIKQKKIACKLKVDDGIGMDNVHRPREESKFGKHVATNQIEESDGTNLAPDQLIVLGLMAPDKCPWPRGRRSMLVLPSPLLLGRSRWGKMLLKENSI